MNIKQNIIEWLERNDKVQNTKAMDNFKKSTVEYIERDNVKTIKLYDFQEFTYVQSSLNTSCLENLLGWIMEITEDMFDTYVALNKLGIIAEIEVDTITI